MGLGDSHLVKSAFNEKESRAIKVLTKSMRDEKGSISQQKINELFTLDLKKFSTLFFNWMNVNKKEVAGKLDVKTLYLDSNIFLISLEVLLKAFGYDILIKKYQGKKLSYIILSMIISAEKLEQKGFKIGKSELSSFLSLYFNLAIIGSENFLNEAIDCLVNYFIPANEEDLDKFFVDFQMIFPRLNSMIESNLEMLTTKRVDIKDRTIHQPSIEKKLLQPTKNSEIISKDLFMIFPLLCNKLYDSESCILLYNSSLDGFSFNRLSNCIKYFNSMMVFLIKTNEEGKIIAVIQDGELFDSAKYNSGTNNNMLIILKPNLKILKCSSNSNGGNNYAYMNTRKIENSQLKRGIGFGHDGNIGKARIWLDGELPDDCTSSPKDDTYDIGKLISEYSFKPLAIEVWGYGGESNLENQEQMRNMDKKNQEKSKTVDKKQFMDSDFDKNFLFEKTFSHSEQKREDT